MKILNTDCIEYMKLMEDNSVNFILTDIPYGKVSREDNGLRNLNRDIADTMTFDLDLFLDECYRLTNNSLCIFCGKEQFSEIYGYFAQKAGTVRPIVYQKSNPSPMNGQYVYLSGVEFAVWFKKRGAKTFNAHCKNTVFTYAVPAGKKCIHETQKPLGLFKELIEDNTNEGDLVFDPCAGSCVTALAAAELNRDAICLELDYDNYSHALGFLKEQDIEFEEN